MPMPSSMSTSASYHLRVPKDNPSQFLPDDLVYYKGLTYRVNFIDQQYITLKHEDSGSLPVVFRQYWDQISSAQLDK